MARTIASASCVARNAARIDGGATLSPSNAPAAAAADAADSASSSFVAGRKAGGRRGKTTRTADAAVSRPPLPLPLPLLLQEIAPEAPEVLPSRLLEAVFFFFLPFLSFSFLTAGVCGEAADAVHVKLGRAREGHPNGLASSSRSSSFISFLSPSHLLVFASWDEVRAPRATLESPRGSEGQRRERQRPFRRRPREAQHARAVRVQHRQRAVVAPLWATPKEE